jgi:hypothetical protein
MPQLEEQVLVAEPSRPMTWKLALLTSGFAGLVGLTIAVQQFVVKFLYDQSAHTRTFWGILFMILGFIGPAMPLLLVFSRRAFARLGKSRQWVALTATPAFYSAALALCLVASVHTKTLIMDRPGLTVVVRYDRAKPNEPMSAVSQGLMRELPSGSGYRAPDGRPRRFHFEAHQNYLRFPQEVTISLEGTDRLRDDGNVEITLNFEVKETFRLQLEGLADVQITVSGKPVSDQPKLEPGEYPIVIIGRPT